MPGPVRGAIFAGMRLNSDSALALGQHLYERYGGDWSRIREAGVRRADGVIDLTQAVSNGGRAAPAPADPADASSDRR